MQTPLNATDRSAPPLPCSLGLPFLRPPSRLGEQPPVVRLIEFKQDDIPAFERHDIENDRQAFASIVRISTADAFILHAPGFWVSLDGVGDKDGVISHATGGQLPVFSKIPAAGNTTSRITSQMLKLTLMVLRTSVLPASSLIITCASSKGGVGKSTSCACLAGAFAHLGNMVHIIDLDSNRTLSRWFGDDRTRPRGISISSPNPQNLTGELQELGRRTAPDYILIDVAGSYERALTVAAARAHLTIIPAGLAEADVYEAEKTAKHIQQIFASFDREPLFRLLLTQVQTLQSHGQKHAAQEIKRMRIPLLNAVLAQRAAYEEIGLSGVPPHYADRSRPTVAKAIAELNALRDEIIILAAKRELKSPALSSAAGAA